MSWDEPSAKYVSKYVEMSGVVANNVGISFSQETTLAGFLARLKQWRADPPYFSKMSCRVVSLREGDMNFVLTEC